LVSASEYKLISIKAADNMLNKSKARYLWHMLALS